MFVPQHMYIPQYMLKQVPTNLNYHKVLTEILDQISGFVDTLIFDLPTLCCYLNHLFQWTVNSKCQEGENSHNFFIKCVVQWYCFVNQKKKGEENIFATPCASSCEGAAALNSNSSSASASDKMNYHKTVHSILENQFSFKFIMRPKATPNTIEHHKSLKKILQNSDKTIFSTQGANYISQYS